MCTQVLQQAYSILKDEELKAAYDQQGNKAIIGSQFSLLRSHLESHTGAAHSVSVLASPALTAHYPGHEHDA